MRLKKILGIDVGGSGIKGAIVNAKTGEMLTERYRIPTPARATPENVSDVITEIARYYAWDGVIGVGFPAVIQNGIARTAANVDKSFIDFNIEKLISKKTNCPVTVVNDADAAGIAELKFGVGKDEKGVVLLITVGTGIGTVLFSNGEMVTNTELGHLLLNTMTGEQYASDAVRQQLNLSWEEWGKRFNEYLKYMEFLFWPDLIIIGGGVSKNHDKFMSTITVKSKVVMAQLQNNAGMIGAAVSSRRRFKIFGEV